MPTTILPRLMTPSDPTAATAGTNAVAKSTRPSADGGALSSDRAAFPAQLKQARAKTSDARSDRAEDGKTQAAPAKKPAKADGAKKVKASKPARKKSELADDGAEDVKESQDQNPADESQDAESGAADPAEGAEAADSTPKKPGEAHEEKAAAEATADAAALASAQGVPALHDASNQGHAEAETPDGDASSQQQNADAAAVARVTGTTPSSDPAAASSSASSEEPADANADTTAEKAPPATAGTKSSSSSKRAAVADEVKLPPEVKPAHVASTAEKAVAPAQDDAATADTAAAAVAQLAQGADAANSNPTSDSSDDLRNLVDALGQTLAAAGNGGAGHAAATTSSTPVAAPPRPDLPPEARFAEANHANVVSSLRAQLMPNGGTMRIRLDPPQLGALQVTVHMRDGVMTASFETSTDEATRLLSHSLSQLKGVLESQGVNVEKLQVQQGPREMQSAGRNDNQQQEQPGGQQQREASRQEQQEHQRREMMRRMWRRLSGTPDPLDVTG